MAARCVKIAVCAPVWGTYTYRVPPSSAARAEVGRRVLVPFGNRTVTGFILSEDGNESGMELKEIQRIFDEPPLFGSAMVPLFEWMADYYVHPPGQVIESVLPAGLNVNPFRCAVLTKEGERALKRLPLEDPARETLGWIGGNPGAKLPWSAKQVDPLVRKGWVSLGTGRRSGRARRLLQRFVCVKDCAGLEAAAAVCARSARAANEQEFLRIFLGRGDAALSRICALFPNGDYLVRKWVRKGVLETFTAPVFRSPGGGTALVPAGPFALNEDQKAVLAWLEASIESGVFAPALLYGVTGSGKTEVYVRAAEKAISLGRQVIVMVPEIALAAYLEGVFRLRLGDRVAVYHSGLSRGERFDAWLQMSAGEVDLVIGARSALFAPVPRLGLIIVDEEHDAAYKQDDRVRYQARDTAVMRAKMEQATVLLGSGTPSVQSFRNACGGRYRMLSMPERVEKRALPRVEMVDMTRSSASDPAGAMLSRELREALKATLEEESQAILFLNRRGFHRLHVCSACGRSLRCPHCDVALTHHLGGRELRCHYCGFTGPVPQTCPECGRDAIKTYGFGTQKLELELRSLFPSARVARMDTDNTRAKGVSFEILKQFKEQAIDILVGTQMVTKGYDFPRVTLVGVIAADLLLNFPDFRAAERTFQVLSQVAGRAGRGDRPGKVIIQAFNVGHYALQAAMAHDFKGFFEREAALRSGLGYPPFAHLVCIRVQGKDRAKTLACAEELGVGFRRMLSGIAGRKEAVQVMGPVEAPIARIKDRYRWQILLKGRKIAALKHLLESMGEAVRTPPAGVQVAVDVDPYQML